VTDKTFIDRPRKGVVFLMAVLLLAVALLVSAHVSQAVATAPSLGTAGSFAVLGGSTVTNTGPSLITGDLGVAPGSAIVGFFPSTPGGPGTVIGTQHAADAVALQAQADAATAYTALSGQACDFTHPLIANIGGSTLAPGVHCFPSSAAITGILTLDAAGDPNAVWVFNIKSTLVTASASSVLIINGGNACNVFWRVGSSATLNTTTAFQGNILALANISALTGATVSGRLLAQTAAVTLDTNRVSLPTNCGVQPPEPGNIVIEAQTLPDGSTVDFNFSAAYANFMLSDGETNDSGNLAAGQYLIDATVPPGWELTSIVCTSAGGSTWIVNLPDSSVQVQLAAGDTVSCVFNMTQLPPSDPGNIIVEKQTLPDGNATSFSFIADYGNFALSDGQTDDSGDLIAGLYDIAENVPTGWDLTSIVCSSGDGSTWTINLPNGAVAVQLTAGDTVTCIFTNTQEPAPPSICIQGAADYQRTTILGVGMGSDTAHKNVVTLAIPNWQTVDSLYGQLAGEQNGAAKYVRFIYPNNTYNQVNNLTSPAYRQWATFWYGADLQPAANIRGRWFLQTSGTKGHIPRAFLLYPTYHTQQPYVNVFDPLALDESNQNHVYYEVAKGWIAEQQYRMAIPAPLAAVTIVVQVALVENDKDNRPLQLTVSADGATPQTVSPIGPSHGNLLNIVTFSLNIPAGTDEIVLDLVSPTPNGDSGAMVGVTAYYACEVN